MDSSFVTCREHLHAELARLDLLIQQEVWRWRQMNSPSPQGGEEFRGLYVSEAEVDAILDGVYPGNARPTHPLDVEPTESAFQQAIERASAEIARRKAASTQAGVALRLERLRALFALTPFDVDILLIGLASEIELKYERLYAYLQDDVTRKRAGVAMILNLLCATVDERLSARRHFLPDAPLLRHQLIALFYDPSQPHPPLLAQYVKPDPYVVEYLLQEDGLPDPGVLDARLRDLCTKSHPTTRFETLLLPSDVKRQLACLAAEEPRTAPTPFLILLQGDKGTGKHASAQAICAARGQPLLTVHLARLPTQSGSFGSTVRLIAREAYLTGAALYWQGYGVLAFPGHDDDPRPHGDRELLHAALFEYPVVSFLPVEDVDRQPDRALLRSPCLVRVTYPRPSYPQRRALWARYLDGNTAPSDADVAAVAGRFRLTGGQIRDAVLDARHRAAQRSPGEQGISPDDLFAAARARTSGQLIDLAKKIEPRHAWEDLVLPADQLTQLHEMCDQMRYRPLVLGEWGFDRKLSLGKGLNALFAGPSGTGKTMAAEVIADDLGLDLYKIDLSTVVSKYVGETEKNLERIFSAARNSNAILFFDEADALFGKRSEVRDAHDRYANVEISYLLQKMEEYDGLVVLTSNLSKNMDEAFMRRMHFTVEFPYPEEDARRRIWEIVLPDEAPLAPDIDFGLLAERYRLTGGNIRNVALTAAFLAARDSEVIGMDHLLWATRREFQKMGRLAAEREFVMESSDD